MEFNHLNGNISTYLREFKVESEQMILNMLGTVSKYSWFSVELEPWNTEYISEENYLFELTIQLSANRSIQTRQIYNFLDWIGDIGGLYDGLRIIG